MIDVAALIRVLGEKGMSPAEIAAIVAEASSPVPAYGMEAAELNARQLRNRRYYENNKRLKSSESKTIKTVSDDSDAIKTVSDASRTRSAQVVVSSSSSLRSEEIGGGGGECGREADDWPDGKPTDHLRRLVEAVGSPWLDPSKSPGLVTTAGRLAAWKRDGASWEHDVVPVVTAVCAKQRSPVSTWKFFDQAIGRSIADNRAALVIPEATAIRATGPPNILDRMKAERLEAERLAFEMLDRRSGRTN